MSKPKITAIAPWFGGKRTLAPEIVKLLGPHRQYFEPFCGSLAVLLAKPVVPNETASDLHYDVINLARVLQIEETAIELYQRLQYPLVTEMFVADAKSFLGSTPEGQDAVERAFFYFAACWLIRNGVAGMDRTSFQIAVRWTSGGGSPSVRFNSARESIPAWHRRLQNVVLLPRDGFKCIPRYEDSESTAIYIDSPYLQETRSHGSYRHDFKSKDGLLFKEKLCPHERLRDLLNQFEKSRIVVSHYDCKRVRQLYDGWTFINKTRQKNLHCQNRRGTSKKDAPEVLIVRN